MESSTINLLWFRKAAEQKHANAQYYMGCMYENGYGVPKNTEEAIKWYQKAAAQGLADAQNKLKQMGR